MKLLQTLPAPLQQALTVRTAGATGVARMVIQGLLEIGDDRAAMVAAVDYLRSRLTGYAPLWHIGAAVRTAHPSDALRRLQAETHDAVERSVRVAVAWVRERPGSVLVAPSSSVVSQVLTRLPDPPPSGEAAIGLAGADAIGPDQVLNILGTRALTEKVPVLVVTTSLKLVPSRIFEELGAPVFERVPLADFAAVALDGEILDPQEAGRRAATLE